MTAGYAVWAPAAGRVELHAGEATYPMRRESSGWWRPERAVPPGLDYGYVGFLQNHDQVGNRARGARIGQLAGLRPDVAVGADGLHLPPTSVAILEAAA
jgi:1,4-alpha-glucan branching enzyme